MTDLERAQRIVLESVHGTPGLCADIADALAAARREGAEEMRERAAQHCIDVIAGWTGRHMAGAIQALPLTPE